jgi:hypothetical protein
MIEPLSSVGRRRGVKGEEVSHRWDKLAPCEFQAGIRELILHETRPGVEAGAERNIAAFYQQIMDGRCENETVPRAVDGVLTTILSREAALRRVQLSMETLLRENRRLTVDLAGLRA